MSHQQQQQHYYDANNNNNGIDEVDAMLNSLVGQQQSSQYNQGYDYGYPQQQQGYNHYNYNANGAPPAVPPRSNHVNDNSSSSSSNKYYYPPENSVYPPVQQATPLPQRVASMPSDYNNNGFTMPNPQQYQGTYPPTQYQQSSPPGSPPPSFPQAHVYQTINGGYPSVVDATQGFITDSYRPTFTNHVSDSTVSLSTPSTASDNTPPYRRAPHQRTNMIMTIERPRYSYLPDGSAVGGDTNAEEMPFIPVSPDTDSDEEYFARPSVTNVTRHPLPVPPRNESIQASQQQEQHHQQEPQQQYHQQELQQQYYQEQQHYEQPQQQQYHQEQQYEQPKEQPKQEEVKKQGMTFNDPTQFYVYPPTKDSNYAPPPQLLQKEVPPLPPATPSHFEIYPPPLQQDDENEVAEEVVPRTPTEPNYGLLSVLSTAFSRHIKGLEHVRELWCASDYNESFTGSEAVTVIKGLLKENVPEEYCVLVANALMRSDPALFSPTKYSQRSLISNTVYNSDDTYFLVEDLKAMPTGVIPSLTPCYSFVCKPGQPGCYSQRCPNNGKDFVQDVKEEVTVAMDATAKSTSTPKDGWLMPHEAWAASVDREVLLTMDPKEIARQEAINEFIYSEEKYLADLTILHEVIVKGVEQSGAMEKERLHNFISTVFNNYQELIQLSDDFFKDLLARYRENVGKCVPMIGDIIVKYIPYFKEPYFTYSPHAILAKYLAEAEIKKNPELDKVFQEINRHERTNRLPYYNYLLSPVTRMQRYPMLLEVLIKRTPENHPDYKFLTTSRKLSKEVAANADLQAVQTKNRVTILNIRDSITFKQNEFHELQLDDPNRKLYHKGMLKRRNGTLDVADKNDIYAFVFDHIMVMTKMRKTNTGEEYRIWKKPIPLQMLVVQAANASNVSPSYYNMPNVTSGLMLILHHLGSKGGAIYPFFCSSLEEKQEWTKAIEDAKVSLKKRHGDADIFDLKPLDDVNFRNIGSGQSTGTTTRVNCSVPFVSLRGEKKIAIGTDNGVFFKSEGQDSSVRRIIQCESVLQLAVMEKYHILIVLTEKALRAYPVDALDSKSNTKAIDRIEVEIAQHVNFFQIGFCNGRDMLVFKKKKNTTSVFTALEPFCDLRDPKNEKLLTSRPSIFSNRPDYLRWFKKYKDFYIGAEASNIHFLKAKLNIVCERGFEVIDPENLTVGRDIPDSEDPEFYFVTRHTEPLKPLAMYRINDKFLLCYDKFAFYVNNRNGSLVPRADKRKPATVCDWEGTPTHIVYEHPYIIAIDPYFIEIRHVDNGELVQIISGENIRLAYYNGGVGDKPVIHVCMSHSQKPDTQALFQLVLNNHRHSAGYHRRN